MASEPKTLQEVEQEIRRRKRTNPLKYAYEPHEFQRKIHRDRHETTIVLGGNRTGKSYGAMAEALFYALGRSEYAEIPDPPNHIWYVVPTSTTYDEAIRPLFDELVPPGEIQSESKRQRRFRFTNGSVISFRTADQQQKRLTGAAVDLVVVDEPIPRDIFKELQARVLSTRGRILMVMTPVDDKADKWLWVRDDLYVPWKAGERPDIKVIHMPVADEEGNPLVPHMTREDIKRYERQYPDPATRAARMYGEFVTRSGLVFSTFDPDIHLIDRFPIPDHWHKWLVCDPQYHRFAVLYFAADPDGNYYVVDEYFSADEPLAGRAERIKAMVGEVDRDVPMYVDYANPQDITELNYHFRRIGADIGAMPLPMQKRVDKMILRTHSMLEPSEDRQYHPRTGLRGVYGAPRLVIFNDLQSSWKKNNKIIRTSRLLWEMQRLTWDRKGKPDKDSAGGGDATDCLIYGCSIMATGNKAPKDDSWKKGMSDRDIMIWKNIEQQDKIKNLEQRWLR